MCKIVQTPCIRTLTNFKDAITAYKLRVNMLILLFRTQENLATYKNIILSCTHNAKIKLKHIYIICMESSFYPLHLKMVYFRIMIPKMVLVFCYRYKIKKYWYSQRWPDFSYMTFDHYIGNNPISFLHLVYIRSFAFPKFWKEQKNL